MHRIILGIGVVASVTQNAGNQLNSFPDLKLLAIFFLNRIAGRTLYSENINWMRGDFLCRKINLSLRGMFFFYATETTRIDDIKNH